MTLFRLNSLSSRLTVTTSFITILLFTISTIYIVMLKSDEMSLGNRRDVSLSLSNTSLTINKRLILVESALNSNMWHIEECVNDNRRDSVVHVLNQIRSLNPDIIGCGVAYYADSVNSDFTPYILYTSDSDTLTVRTMPCNADDEDYNNFFWLQYPIRTHRPQWSAPHSDITNTATRVCSFTIPVNCKTTDFKTLLFADIPVSSLLNTIHSNLSKSVVDALLIDSSNGGKIVSSYESEDEDRALAKSFNTKTIDHLITLTGDSIAEGRSGSFDYVIDDRHYPCFFNVVNNSGWVLYFFADFSDFSSSLFKGIQVLLIIFVVTIVILYFLFRLVIKQITRPLRLFSDSALEISKGNFNVELPQVDTDDEMALLHDSFETMRQSLATHIDELEKSTQRQAFIKGELQIASRIQDDLLPKSFPPFPERDDINVRAVLIPAKDIGGDLYNYFIRDDKLYFVIADVSGKSVPAAIVMAITCNVFNTVAPHASSTSSIMHELNVTTCANNENTGFFITVLVGILNLRTGDLQLCNAGHDPALIVNPYGEVSLLRITPNLPVGVLADFEYKSIEMKLARGSKLVLYTDGVTEAQNAYGDLFGTNRLIDIVSHNNHKDIADIIELITSEVMNYSKDVEQTDDLTLVAIDYNPSEIPLPNGIELNFDINELHRVREYVNVICRCLNGNEDLHVRLNLVLEEAVTNIISHASSKGKNSSITLFSSVHFGVLSIIVSDNGHRFDPLQVPEIDVNAPLEDRPIGGLGVPLMRKMTTSMIYNYHNGRNCLTLRFNLSD